MVGVMVPPLPPLAPLAPHQAPAQSSAAGLPGDILDHIVSKLDLEDRLTTGKICRSWRTSARSPGLWREDLARLPQSPEALKAGTALLAGLARPDVEPDLPGGCIIGRNQRDLQHLRTAPPDGYHLTSGLHLLRPPNSASIRVSLDGFPYTFGPEQRLAPLPVPSSFTLPLPPLGQSVQMPYPPLPDEVDLTPLMIERQLARQWRRFDGAVCYAVPRLEAMVRKMLAHNQRAVATMHLQTSHQVAQLEHYIMYQAPEEGPYLGAKLRAYDRELDALEVTARFLQNFSGYPPQARWHVHPPRWLMVALSQGWLDYRPQAAAAIAAGAADEAPMFHYMGAGPPPICRPTPTGGP